VPDHLADGATALSSVSTSRLISLQTLTSALASTLDVRSVAHVVLSQGVMTLEADAASLYLLAPGADRLECIGVEGALAFGRLRPSIALDEYLPTAVALRSAEAVWLKSPAEWDERFPNAVHHRQELGVGSACTIPLIADGTPLGVLSISFRRPQTFVDHDRLFILIAAGQCALALHRAILFEAERAAALEARLERERLAALFTQAPSLVIAFRGPQQTVEFCSDSVLRLLPGRHAVGRPAREIAPDLAGQGILEALDGVFIHGTPFVANEVPLSLRRRRSGRREQRYLNVVIQPTRDREGTITGTIFHGTDVTDLVEARKHTELLAAERDVVLEQMVDGLLLVDAGGTITYANRAAHSLLGRELVGAAADALWQTASEEPVIAHALSDGIPATDLLADIRRPDGSRLDVQASVTPIHDEDHVPLGAVVTIRDISQQRLLERQKDDFLSAVAHDLKTPLTVIRGMTQLIARDIRRGTVQPDARVFEHLDTITATTSRMTAMINGLLDLTRLEVTDALQLDRVRVDLVEVVRAAVAEQAHHSRHSIEVQARGPVEGYWDRHRLARVAGNLLGNAIRYSPHGGTITCTAAREGETAVLAITDNGIGIPADDLPHIFDRFYRGSNTEGIDGAGIGLAGVRAIVEQHGGWITVESGSHGGSTFTVRLPLGRET